MKNWYHTDCLFEAFTRQRATTKKITCADDIGGWDDLNNDQQESLLKKIQASGGSGSRPAAKKVYDFTGNAKNLNVLAHCFH